MMTTTLRRKPPTRLDRILATVPIEWYFSVGSLGIIYESCKDTSVTAYLMLSAWMFFCVAMVMANDKYNSQITSGLNKFLKTHRVTGIYAVVFGAIALSGLCFALATPANAAFFSSTVNGISAALAPTVPGAGVTSAISPAPAGVTNNPNYDTIYNIVSIIFNALRVMVIIAVAYGSYKVVAARDDQEDMKMQARLPIVVVIMVAIVDGMSALVFAT